MKKPNAAPLSHRAQAIAEWDAVPIHQYPITKAGRKHPVIITTTIPVTSESALEMSRFIDQVEADMLAKTKVKKTPRHLLFHSN